MSRRAPLRLLAALLALSTASCQGFQPSGPRPQEEPLVFPEAPGSPVSPVIPPAAAKTDLNVERLGAMLRGALARVNAAKDLHCTLVRREVVGDALQDEERIDFTERFSPHALRLEWTGERFRGRKMLYVEGANDDKVLVREPGFLARRMPPLRFSLDSILLRPFSRHPPDRAGYLRLVRRMVRDFDLARGAGRVAVAVFQPVTTDGRRLRRFEMTVSPVVAGLDVSRMIVWFDETTGLPAHTVLHDAGGRLVEDYDWRELRLDRGITDADLSI